MTRARWPGLQPRVRRAHRLLGVLRRGRGHLGQRLGRLRRRRPGSAGSGGGVCSLIRPLPALPLRSFPVWRPGARCVPGAGVPALARRPAWLSTLRARPASLPPAISRPSSSAGTVGGRKPVILPFVHDRDPVRQRVDLVEFRRDDQHRHAVIALLDDAPVHELDRAHVQPAGRLAGHEHLVLLPELPGQDHLLLVAAGQRAHRRGRRAGPDVEFTDQLGRPAGHRAEVEPDPRRERRLVVLVQHHVVGHREVADQPVFLPVLRNVGHAGPEPLGRRGAGQVPAAQSDAPRGGGPQSHQRLAQLGLPVALHPGHAQDLSRPDLEGHPVHPDPAGLVGHRQVGHVQDHLAGLGLLLADPQLHVPADHQGGELVFGGRRWPLADHRAPPQHGDRVGDGLDFLELVRDEHDRGAARRELPDDPEQVLGLSRGQHRGRLVEDQHGRVPDQCLDDLDPLLDAHRQVLHQRVRVYLQAVAVRQLAHLPPRPAPVKQAAELGHGREETQEARATIGQASPVSSMPRVTFSATVNTGTSMKCWCTIPIPAAMASFGESEADRLAVDQDLALVGLQQSVQHVHQGGLARAVLAEQGVDLTRSDRQVDPVVGHQRAEPLGDAPQLKFHFGPLVPSAAHPPASPSPGAVWQRCAR